MNSKIGQLFQLLPMALMSLMAVTRFDHFGSAFSLPDASLAVFFVAGMKMTSRWFFALLLVEAGLIDYLAIAQFNVSDYCISPAYIFLIPTYAVVWFAGRYCSAFKSLNVADSSKVLGWLIIATTGAFIISNGSFYLFSGRFDQLSWIECTAKTLQYYPLYLGSALIYSMICLGLVKLWQSRFEIIATQS